MACRDLPKLDLIKVTPLGGPESRWETERSKVGGVHNVNPVSLYYRRGEEERELVKEGGVHVPTYIGEDCVLYQELYPKNRWLSICGDKAEKVVSDEWGSRWRVAGESLIKTYLHNDGHREVVETLSFAEIRSLAQSQPPREPQPFP